MRSRIKKDDATTTGTILMLSTIEQTGTRLLLSQRYAPFFRRVSPKLYVRTMSDHVAIREPEMVLLPLFCSNSTISVDVGVLWGAFSYRMAKLSRQCYAFEANPEQIPFLRRSVASNVKLIPEALSDHEGTSLLRLPYDVPGHATIEPANDLQGRPFKEYSIRCSTLDSHNLERYFFYQDRR